MFGGMWDASEAALNPCQFLRRTLLSEKYGNNDEFHHISSADAR